MARKGKRSTPEEIVGKLRQVEVLTSQGKLVADAVRAIGVTEASYYRWRAEYGGLKLDQVKRLKLLVSGDRVNPSGGDIRNPATLRSRERQVDGSIERFSTRQGRAGTADEDAGRGGGDAAASQPGLGHATDRGRGWMQSGDGAAVSGVGCLGSVPGFDPAQPAGGTRALAG